MQHCQHSDSWCWSSNTKLVVGCRNPQSWLLLFKLPMCLGDRQTDKMSFDLFRIQYLFSDVILKPAEAFTTPYTVWILLLFGNCETNYKLLWFTWPFMLNALQMENKTPLASTCRYQLITSPWTTGCKVAITSSYKSINSKFNSNTIHFIE